LFASSALPFGDAATEDLIASDSIWEDLDSDIVLFLAIEELMSGEQASKPLATQKA
jgi:hypothetical protein